MQKHSTQRGRDKKRKEKLLDCHFSSSLGVLCALCVKGLSARINKARTNVQLHASPSQDSPRGPKKEPGRQITPKIGIRLDRKGVAEI
jgi:hypothetical protein